jgi:anaerobic magnesium-protoporphyrin IX monomethyl ester cyclase
MRTLLIHQPFRFDLLEACLPTIIPRNLLMIGACLQSKGFPVRIHDMQVAHPGLDSIPRALAEYSPDLVGISIHAAPYIPSVKACCAAVKAAMPDVPIVVGGIFTSSYKEKIFDVIPEIDIIVLNEGEETIVDLADALSRGRPLSSVPGIVYRNGAGAVTTLPRPMVEDLTGLPMPAYDLLDIQRYRRPGLLPPNLEAQRGCSYTCKFCGVHFPNRGRVVRFRDPRKVADEMELLHESYGFDRFFFSDDTFTINPKFVHSFCEEVIGRGLHRKMKWTAYTRADRIDRDLAKLLASSGCTCLAMGVETGAHQDTASIDKRESINDYKKGIEVIKEAGMDVHSLIIFGFPEVTHNDIPMAARFLLDTKPTMSQFFIFHPVPGTEFFAEPEKHGLHFRFDKLEDWYKMDFIEEPLCDTQHLTREEIIKYFIQYNLAFNSYESPGENPALQQRLLRNAIPRKKREVVLVRTGQTALYSSPVLPAGMRYADMHKNARRLDEMQYEVLLRSNGDFTIEEIAERFAKLFDYTYEDALAYVVHALRRFEQLEIIHELPALRELEPLIAVH